MRPGDAFTYHEVGPGDAFRIEAALTLQRVAPHRYRRVGTVDATIAGPDGVEIVTAAAE